MALASYAVPFGLRQVKLVPLDEEGDEITAEAVFLPASRTFSFADAEEFQSLQGNDRTVASVGAGPTVDWELEGGGISLAAWKVMAGGTTAQSGVTPSMVNKYTKKTSDARPYFNVYGRSVNDNGGDFECVVRRCKADSSLEGSLENGSFLLTSASGKGYGNEVDEELYTFEHRETATPLVIP